MKFTEAYPYFNSLPQIVQDYLNENSMLLDGVKLKESKKECLSDQYWTLLPFHLDIDENITFNEGLFHAILKDKDLSSFIQTLEETKGNWLTERYV